MIHQFALSLIHLAVLHLGNLLYAFLHETHVLRLFTVCKTSVYGIREMEMSYVGWCQAFLVGGRRFPILLRITLLCSLTLSMLSLFFLPPPFLSLFRSLYIKSNFLLNFKLRKANWKQYSAIRLLVSSLYYYYFLIAACIHDHDTLLIKSMYLHSNWCTASTFWNDLIQA